LDSIVVTKFFPRQTGGFRIGADRARQRAGKRLAGPSYRLLRDGLGAVHAIDFPEVLRCLLEGVDGCWTRSASIKGSGQAGYFASPNQAGPGAGQGRGNSGVYLQGRYEIQVLDSNDNPTYADGQAGAIYGQWPPLVNAVRPTGEFNSYDIVFEAPHFDGGKLVKPAFITVFLNGILLHNRKEAMGPTLHRELAHYEPAPAEDSLVLQDHNHPVRYRNVWVRRLKGYDLPEK